MKIFFVVRNLAPGGAEIQLVRTASGLAARNHEVVIVTKYHDAQFVEALTENIGFKLLLPDGEIGHALTSRFLKVWRFIQYLIWLRSEVVAQRPDILYGFMAGANIACTLAALGTPTNVVWGRRSIRSKNLREEMRVRNANLFYWIAAKLERMLANLPQMIVTNSEAGRDGLIAAGYPPARIRSIPNVIDTSRSRPDGCARASIRRALGVSDQDVLVGLVGKVVPVKGHKVFVQAASLAHERESSLRFVCIGAAPDTAYQENLLQLARDKGIGDDLTWVPHQSDIERWLAGIDILVSSSYIEGFSNSIAEAMATGCYCVVTDVGDSARIVAGFGSVVPPGDAASLAEAVVDASRTLEHYTGSDARQYIVDNFSTEKLLSRTESMLRQINESQ